MNSSVPKINLKSTLNWNSIGKAILDLILISFFTMLASIIALISMLVNNGENINFEKLYSQGNFFLYAISLFSSSLIYYLHKKDKLFGKYFVMILITICAISYSQLINFQNSTTNFTKYGSIISIILASIAFAITQYHQHLIILDLNKSDINNQKKIIKHLNFNK